MHTYKAFTVDKSVLVAFFLMSVSGLLSSLLSLDMRKLVFGVSDKVRHKPGCTATEDGMRLEIFDLDRRGILLSVWRKQRR